MHYYKFNIGSYRKETMHLSLLEHGIYRALLDTYYMNEGPLCGDDAKLMRTHTIRTDEEKEAFQAVMSEFFLFIDGQYVHEDCDELIAKYHAKSEKARQSANKRWEKDASALRSECEGNANQEPLTINQETDTSNDGPDAGASTTPKQSNCDFQMIVDAYHETLPELRRVVVVNDKRKRAMRARWRSDKRHQTREFWLWAFGQVRNNDFWMGRVKDWSADLDFLLREENLTKLIETGVSSRA